MGDVAVDKQRVIQHVFKQYDSENVGELTSVQVHNVHADIRMGGISMPQVLLCDIFDFSGRYV